MRKNRYFKKLIAGIVSTATLVSSFSFIGATNVAAAGSHNYAEALELSLYFYDANQCGNEVDDNCLTWRGNCHTYDAKADLNSATGLSAEAKAIVSAQNGGGNTADVSGGYHDAGDHVKFNLTMAFNGASLGWAYFAYPEAFEDTKTTGHLKYIMKETSDFMMKTTYLDDKGDVAAICHTVSDSSDHHITWGAPEAQTYNRPTYWLSGSKTNNRICYLMAASLASTAYVFKNQDADYSGECLKYAEAIYEYSNKYSGNETSGMGDMYGTDTSNVAGDKALAEAWLYLADSSKHPLPTAKPTSNGCYDGSNYDGWIYSWGKTWGGYACIMARITGDSAYINEVKYNSDRFSKNNAKEYYIINDWGNSRYNCAWQTYALTYGELANSQDYLNAAQWQMDFILGTNPAGYSYLVGYGNKYPTRIHHRAANPNKGESTYTLYGALIGGASDSSGSITDAVDSYAQTEMALDYNACFTVAIAGLYKFFGGDTSSAAAVIAKAPEIDADFDFGMDEQQTPTCTVNVSVVDAETGKPIPDINAYIMSNENAADSKIAEWNTSDENPKSLVIEEPSLYPISSAVYLENVPASYNYEKQYSFSFKEYGEVANIVIELEPIEIKYGDANDNGTVEIADAVFILQGIADPSNTDFIRTTQGERNADCHNCGNGVDAEDALAIQQLMADIIKSLPINK